MDYYSMTAQETLKALGTDLAHGLTPEQAAAQQEAHGRNELTRQKPISMARRFVNALADPMIILLIVAALITVGVNLVTYFTEGHADWIECVGIFGAILLSVIITVVMEGRSAKAFEELNKMSSDVTVKVLRSGERLMLPVSELAVGDIVYLATGDKIPADGRLIESTDLMVDESMLTGESKHVAKKADVVFSDEKTPLAERKNCVYSGCFVTAGNGIMVVTEVGDATQFGKIAAELGHASESSTPLQEKLAKLGKYIAIAGGIAAAFVFIVQVVGFVRADTVTFATVTESFITSIVLMVAAVPEGLPTIVAISLAINVVKMSKQRALVKKMQACETIGCINVICSDKTGTLTQNRMTVMSVYMPEGTADPDQVRKAELLDNFCINGTADIHTEGDTDTFVGNPTECSLLVCARKSGVDYLEKRSTAKVVKVFPFSSDTKRMTTVLKREGSYTVLLKGGPEKVLPACAMSGAEAAAVQHQIEEYQNKAYRVLAFAHKAVASPMEWEENRGQLESGMTFDGVVAIADPLRADVPAAIAKCRGAGIKVKMLTGDNIVTATAIAKELELFEDGDIALTAAEIEEMDDDQLRGKLPHIRVIARSTPSVKMRVVKLLKAQGNVVAVTGDGINDAPALKNADVGLAMGIAGTEVSKEASDVVLMDDSFSTIARAVEWGRGIYENFRRFIQFQLTANLSSVAVVISSVLMGFAAPFTAIQLLWINLIMDGPLAITLGLEPIRGDLMNRRPTRRDESIISRDMIARILISGVYIAVLCVVQRSTNFLGGTPEQMATILFALFAFFQLFNAFNCRELGGQPIVKNLLKNRLMLLVFAMTFVLQFVMTQFAGVVFGTVPLDAALWGKIILLALTIIPVSEIFRFIIRAIGKHVRREK